MIFVGVLLILLSSWGLIWSIPKVWDDSYQGERVRPIHVWITVLSTFSGLGLMAGIVFIAEALF